MWGEGDGFQEEGSLSVGTERGEGVRWNEKWEGPAQDIREGEEEGGKGLRRDEVMNYWTMTRNLDILKGNMGTTPEIERPVKEALARV